MAIVEVDSVDAIATITLNRPQAMNALSFALRDALYEAMAAAAADDAVHVIILTGAGERAFSAGLDLKEIGRYGLRGRPVGSPSKNLMDAIQRRPKPVIGAIDGVAVTGGLELALACDILIASRLARFADTHVRVGVTPGWGLSQKLSRLIGISRAKELSLSGNYIDAETAMAWGLVSRVVPPGELSAAARSLALDIAQCEPGR